MAERRFEMYSKGPQNDPVLQTAADVPVPKMTEEFAESPIMMAVAGKTSPSYEGVSPPKWNCNGCGIVGCGGNQRRMRAANAYVNIPRIGALALIAPCVALMTSLGCPLGSPAG